MWLRENCRRIDVAGSRSRRKRRDSRTTHSGHPHGAQASHRAARAPSPGGLSHPGLRGPRLGTHERHGTDADVGHVGTSQDGSLGRSAASLQEQSTGAGTLSARGGGHRRVPGQDGGVGRVNAALEPLEGLHPGDDPPSAFPQPVAKAVPPAVARSSPARRLRPCLAQVVGAYISAMTSTVTSPV
jgi:hypothetical protein